MKTAFFAIPFLGAFAVFVAIALAQQDAKPGSVAESADAVRRRQLGEELLLAAEQRDWRKAEQLLLEGADPNVTVLPKSALGPEWVVFGGERDLTRATALSHAASQGNTRMVTMLLQHGADLRLSPNMDMQPLLRAVKECQTDAARILLDAGADLKTKSLGAGSALEIAQRSGCRAMITLFEDRAAIPAHQRSVVSAPFTRCGRTAQYKIVPETDQVRPMRRLLWVSDHELLLIGSDKPKVLLLNLKTERAQEQGKLARCLREESFDADLLTISPDGRWLVGQAGTKDKPTWLATEIFGRGEQTWPREDRRDSKFIVESEPPIAWLDGKRWMEINRSNGQYVVRIRTVGSTDVDEQPLVPGTSMHRHSRVRFSFPTPKEGLMTGAIGFGKDHFVTWLHRVVPMAEGWRINSHEVRLLRREHAGSYFRCAPSPDGKTLAWLNYIPTSEAKTIVLTDADGSRPRIAYEYLYSIRNHKRGRSLSPSGDMLEWNPAGDALLFWRGDGSNGLCLLPIDSVEAGLPEQDKR